VIEGRGEGVTLLVGARRIRVDASVLLPAGPTAAPPPPVSGGLRLSAEPAEPAVMALDVRGLDGVDAWSAVDRALDRCLLEHRGRLEIVHGKGSGALRRHLSEQLRRDPRIRRAAVGGDGEFDEGVTVVEL
jgi:DNA mismatch repair protein MutS2